LREDTVVSGDVREALKEIVPGAIADVETAKPEPSTPEPSVRAWLSQGRDLGRAMALRYAAKLRSLTRR
jgi:hypothetical protein